MLRTPRSRIWLTAALTMTTALVAGTVSATSAQDGAPVTLRLAVPDGPGRPTEPVVQAFVAAASELSGGAVTIEPRFGVADDPSGDPGKTFEVGTANLLLDGSFDLAIVASRAWDQVGVDDFRALQAPFLIDDDALAEAVATSEVARMMLDGISAHGVVGLELWPEDLRHPATYPGCSDPLLSPDDLEGLEVRVTPSGVGWDLIRGFGGQPSFGDRGPCGHQATESGMSQWLSLQDGMTFTGDVTFYPKFQVIAANAAAFERLSDPQRQAVRDAAAVARDFAIDTRPSDAESAAAWCEQGAGRIVHAGPGGTAAFRAAAQPVYDRLAADPVASEAIEMITALKETIEPAPGAIACGVEAVPADRIEAATGPTPIDGTYATHLSFEDLASSPLLYDVGEVNDGNWGDLTFEFDSGTFTHTQANPRQSFVYETSGPYNVDGDVLTFYDPNACCPTVPFSYRWSLEGDTLTLERIDGLVGPTMFLIQPFTRVPEDGGATAGATPIDGTYITHVSFEDLASSPLLYDRGEAHDRNWGDMTFEFDAGTFSHTLENPKFQAAESGTYSLDGDVLVLDFTSRYPEETFSYRWSLDGDSLTLERIPDLEGPTPFIVKPWTRLPDEAAPKEPVGDPSGIPADGTWRIDVTREAMEEAGLPEDVIFNVAGVYTWSFQGSGDGRTGTYLLSVQSPEWPSFTCDGEYALGANGVLLMRSLTLNNCGLGEAFWRWSVDEQGNGYVEVLDTPGFDVVDREMWKSAPFVQIEG